MGKLEWRLGNKPGPMVEFLLIPSGLFDRSAGDVSSGWLLWDGRSGRESRRGSSSSERGNSDDGGRTGKSVAFKYSLPRGLSSVCIYTGNQN